MTLSKLYSLPNSLAVGILALSCIPFTGPATQLTTATGAGADIEMVERNDPNAARTGSADLNTRWNGTDRNEVVGLRFDLSGYTVSTLKNVSLNLINYRTNTSRTIDIYGVTQGAVGGTDAFTTETWNDTSLTAWGDLPGLLESDSTDTTLSIDTTNLTLLVDDFTISSLDEGSVESITSPTLTSFVQNYTGSSRITLLITQGGSGSGGQFRFASREATELATPGLFTGPAGSFAPYLEFDAAAEPPADGLRITNITLAANDVVLSGAGGSHSGPFVVLANNDLALPATNWPAVSTNKFDSDGGFTVTNARSPGARQQFFQLLSLTPDNQPDFSMMGFATAASGTTGGEGGLTQTVSTASAFASAVSASGSRVVLVDGPLELNGGLGSVNINSDKTIQGIGSNAWISGQLQISGKSNVIIRNLTVSNNGAPSTLDGVRIVNGAHHVWVDHCTFVDCSDGSVDTSVGSDYVTISWCKFTYVNQTEHRFVNLIGASDTDAGNYRITFHHNWWSTGCDQRMPMSRYGTVHLFNNYYFAPGNSYCSNARTNAQFLSEHNFYRQVDDPIYKESNGRIKTVDNVYQNCTGRIDSGTDMLDTVLSPPPYSHALDVTMDVPSIVTNNAGMGRGPFAP